jgi:IS30 family transposase
MPYTHYTTDERNALQAMEGMGLPKCYEAVILGKHLGSVYRELDRNSSGGVDSLRSFFAVKFALQKNRRN